MATSRRSIVTGYAQMWPREIFDIREGNTIVAWKERLLAKPRVYVLYRDDHPNYIGMTRRSLFGRIWPHANMPKDKYYNFWNFFSAFVVPDTRHIGQVEGILIAAMPTANSANPRIKRINFSPAITRVLKKLRRQAVESAMRSKGGAL